MSVATERIKEERKQCEEDITKFEDKLRNELLLLLLLVSYLTTVTLQPRLLFKGPF